MLKLIKARMRYEEWQNITSGLRGSDNLPVRQRYSDTVVKNYVNEQATQGINTHRLDMLKLYP